MRNYASRLPLLIAATGLAACLHSNVQAQVSLLPQASSSHAASTAHATLAYNAEDADPYLPAGWQHIPRLRTLTTFMQRDTTIADAIRALRLSTGAKLRAEGNEVLPAHVCLRYVNVPLADVLRGIAATRSMQWVKAEGGELVLREHRQHALDVFHPHSEAEAEVFRKGEELLKQVAALPPDMLQQLKHPPNLSNGLPFASMPPAMQQAVRAMFTASVQVNQEVGLPTFIDMSELPDMCVRMNVNEQETLTGYRFLISTNGKGADMSMCKFRDPGEDYAVIPKEAISSLPPAYPEDAAMQQEAREQSACLKTRVTITAGTYTLPEVLFALAAQAHFHVALRRNPVSIVPRPFRCEGETLGDVLPRLCRTFGYTVPSTSARWVWSWNWRKGDFFVFHDKPDTSIKPDKPGKSDTQK